jgi:(1->4)-alpha-D-glucan 1-alpha-D-glucosylmutase
MRVPRATYRLQLGPDLSFGDLVPLAPYLARLGVSHAYLSPILPAAPGSTHGYDVVAHESVSGVLGGEAALRAAAQAFAELGLGFVVDIVPNHVALPVPEDDNPVLWEVLRDGPEAAHAGFFDVDWSAGEQINLPLLGRPLTDVLAAGELAVDGTGGPSGEPVLRYFDHVLPIRTGTTALPLPELIAAQHYRLVTWRRGNDEVNYRRFFDVDTLFGIRVEDPEVFAYTHHRLLQLLADGVVEGFRIDHVDGLADPGGYLERLAGAAGAGTWTVVEKILVGEEELPSQWPVAGTTGYDALWRIGALYVDPAGALALQHGFAEVTGDRRDWPTVARESRRYVLSTLLGAEVDRLAALALAVCQEDPAAGRTEPTLRGLTDAVVEVLVHIPVYRLYVVPGRPPSTTTVDAWDVVVTEATTAAPHRAGELALIRDLALGRFGSGPRKDEFVRRLQQTCGPAVAKGVEDTAAYRWAPLTSLNEVGSEPDQLGLSPAAMHRWVQERAARWPTTMNALSTHDTKRGEDVRARVSALSEAPARWLDLIGTWTASLVDTAGAADGSAPIGPDDPTVWLLWQTLWGAWPLEAARAADYVRKAAREAKLHTSWLVPAEAYEAALVALAEGALADPRVRVDIEALEAELAPAIVANILGARAVHLLLPGVPDVYQGTEGLFQRLVDPDNRTAPDWAGLAVTLDRALAEDGAGVDPSRDLALAKTRLTALALAVRRDHPDCFDPGRRGYAPLTAHGPAAGHFFGFRMGPDVAVTTTRLAMTLTELGGWSGTWVDLPVGPWRDLLTGREHRAGSAGLSLDELHAAWPVALLVRGS